MNNLLLNSSTRSAIDNFLNAPSHALLLIGVPGSGKKHLARYIAARMLEVPLENLGHHPNFLEVARDEGKKDIPIESVRQVGHMLTLKNSGRRLIIINDAHYMNSQAQNAFLKSLEEPPEGTIFILTSSSSGDLLPTIISRAQKVTVHPITADQASKYYSDQHNPQQILAAWQLSQGAVGMLHSTLAGEDTDMQQALDQAKEILRHKTYDRLVDFDRLSKNKDNMSLTLEAMAKIVKVLYRQAIESKNEKRAKALLKSSKLIIQAQESLQASVSPKLVSLKLILNLPI